ncbi:hypothetical protein EMIHUDRAFT_453986 [Emiliania huxleyi CCMP1516]|uniref:Uncharacterized protein n=2 Tax=Emiliania huxleyi TaxID=2903 RepID=A0A0D3HYP4_EMIH1|nr:hypothetical protein EMIHUDRAFT_453986 [Emiliania huxleyi CCMP1516]EOD04129.1 hypothetical protein EMIHUDRAFT_453986 [Emiliania huxleyi CCMP1516]|eukprot:XP_005756558.1 hypothetical protein EMIHUDRAFT_453986 [Emiliania huxleyi CCMP1516]
MQCAYCTSQLVSGGSWYMLADRRYCCQEHRLSAHAAAAAAAAARSSPIPIPMQKVCRPKRVGNPLEALRVCANAMQRPSSDLGLALLATIAPNASPHAWPLDRPFDVVANTERIPSLGMCECLSEICQSVVTPCVGDSGAVTVFAKDTARA